MNENDIKRLQRILAFLNEQKGKIVEIEALLGEKIKAKNELSNQKRIYSEALAFLRSLEDIGKNRLIEVERNITKILQNVFSQSYRFRFVKEGNSTSFQISKKFGEKEIMIPLENGNIGGGIKSLVSILFRLFLKIYLKNLFEGPLVIDEGARSLSKEKTPVLFDFLAWLSKKVDLQIIFISHDANLTTEIASKWGKVIKIVQDENNFSKVCDKW